MISQSLGEGIWLTHKNWKVILYQIILFFALSIVFLILIVAPSVLAFKNFTTDLEQIRYFFQSKTYPVDVMEKYLKLGGIIAVNFLFYLIYSIITCFFIIGGTIGTLKNSLENKNYKTSFFSYFKEGGLSLLPFTGILSIISVLLLISFIIFFLLLETGFDKALLLIDKGVTPGYYQYIVNLSSILPVSLFILTILFLFTVTVYSLVGVRVKNEGTFKTLRNSFALFEKRPLVMSFFALLILIFISVSVCLIMVSFPYSLVVPEFELPVYPLSLAYCLIAAYIFTFITASVISSYHRLCSLV